MHANGLLHLLKVHVHLAFLHVLEVLVLLGLLPTLLASEALIEIEYVCYCLLTSAERAMATAP